MLEANGRRLLEIIGKTPAAQGIVQVAQMPEAIARLEAAIAQEQAAQQKKSELGDDAENKDTESTLSLRQRASPFVDLLKQCSQAGTDLVWGV